MPSLLDNIVNAYRTGGLVFAKARAKIIYVAIAAADPHDAGMTFREIEVFTGLSPDTIRAGVHDLVTSKRATLVQPIGRGTGNGRGRAPWRVHVHEPTGGKFAAMNNGPPIRSLFDESQP